MFSPSCWEFKQNGVLGVSTPVMNCLAATSICLPSVSGGGCREWYIAMKSYLIIEKVWDESRSAARGSVCQDDSTRRRLGAEGPLQGAPQCQNRGTKGNVTEPHLPLLKEKDTACQISACNNPESDWCGWSAMFKVSPIYCMSHDASRQNPRTPTQLGY